MHDSFKKHISQQLAEIRAAGTYKSERVITTPQGTAIRVSDGRCTTGAIITAPLPSKAGGSTVEQRVDGKCERESEGFRAGLGSYEDGLC